MTDRINVNMGSFMVAPAPAILEAKGIGSCIAVCLYSKKKKIAGIARIMAPRPKELMKQANPIRFADDAISVTAKTGIMHFHNFIKTPLNKITTIQISNHLKRNYKKCQFYL